MWRIENLVFRHLKNISDFKMKLQHAFPSINLDTFVYKILCVYICWISLSVQGIMEKSIFKSFKHFWKLSKAYSLVRIMENSVSRHLKYISDIKMNLQHAFFSINHNDSAYKILCVHLGDFFKYTMNYKKKSLPKTF